VPFYFINLLPTSLLYISILLKGGVRVGFININDMYKNNVGKGGVYAHEAYEVK
jgi:hypothetical protein